MKSLLQRLRKPILWILSREAGLFETISGGMTVGWGLLALQTFPEDDMPGSLGIYGVQGIQYQAAVCAILLGLGQVFICDWIDSRWDKHWVRWGAAILSTWFWLSISVSTVVWNTNTYIAPGTVVIWGLFLGNAILCPKIMGWINFDLSSGK